MKMFEFGSLYYSQAMNEPTKLSYALESVDTPAGRERLAAYLESRPFPHYQPHPEKPGLLVRINEDGSRTTGRFVNRKFKPI
jgi:hypothetical protein